MENIDQIYSQLLKFLFTNKKNLMSLFILNLHIKNPSTPIYKGHKSNVYSEYINVKNKLTKCAIINKKHSDDIHENYF